MKKLLIFLFLWVSYISFSQNIIWDKFEDFTTKNISSKTTGQPMSISIAHTISVSGTVEVPKNVTLLFENNGVLKIANEDARLIIHGPIEAGKKLIFLKGN